MIIGDGMRIRDIRIAARPMTAVDMRITIGITAGVPFTMTIIGETTGMTQIDIGIVTTIVMTIGNQRNRISPNLKRIRRIGTIEKNGIIAMGERSNNSTIGPFFFADQYFLFMFRLYVDNDLILKIGLYFHDGFDIYDRLPVRPEKFIGI